MKGTAEEDLFVKTPGSTHEREAEKRKRMNKRRKNETAGKKEKIVRKRTGFTQWRGMGRCSRREDLSLRKKMRKGKIEDENKRSLVRLYGGPGGM